MGSLFDEPLGLHRHAAVYEAYQDDHALLAELGLPTVLRVGTPVNGHGFHILGTVPADTERGRCSVDVSVQCWPAQFWRFVVKGDLPDTHAATVETGSGAFRDYWPSVELMAIGMFHVKEVGL